MRKFVIIKHLQDNGKYLFQVPKGVDLKAGNTIVCDTSRGVNQLGVCCCDSFVADETIVCPLFGTQTPKLRFVTGRVEYAKFNMEDEEDDGEE